jgi:hypothetical protein
MLTTIELVGGCRRNLPELLPDSDSMGSIFAIPNARNVPSFLCHERFNEAGFSATDEDVFQGIDHDTMQKWLLRVNGLIGCGMEVAF